MNSGKPAVFSYTIKTKFVLRHKNLLLNIKNLLWSVQQVTNDFVKVVTASNMRVLRCKLIYGLPRVLSVEKVVKKQELCHREQREAISFLVINTL